MLSLHSCILEQRRQQKNIQVREGGVSNWPTCYYCVTHLIFYLDMVLKEETANPNAYTMTSRVMDLCP